MKSETPAMLLGVVAVCASALALCIWLMFSPNTAAVVAVFGFVVAIISLVVKANGLAWTALVIAVLIFLDRFLVLK